MADGGSRDEAREQDDHHSGILSSKVKSGSKSWLLKNRKSFPISRGRVNATRQTSIFVISMLVLCELIPVLRGDDSNDASPFVDESPELHQEL